MDAFINRRSKDLVWDNRDLPVAAALITTLCHPCWVA